MQLLTGFHRIHPIIRIASAHRARAAATMDDSTSDIVSQFLSSRLDLPRSGQISHFDRLCQELGIPLPYGDSAAETVAALMPAGGPARDQIPPIWVNLAAAALTWASATAFYPPVWVGGSRYDVSVISVLCGVSLPDDPKEFWTRAIPALRERFCHSQPSQLCYVPAAGFTRSRGNTIVTNEALRDEYSGIEYQLLCDDEGITLPFDENDILRGAAQIDSHWALNFTWGHDFSPRELVAVHAWFDAGSSLPRDHPRWLSLPKYLICRAEVAHRVRAGTSINNRPDPISHVRTLRQAPRLATSELSPPDPISGDDAAILAWLTYGTGYMGNPGTPFYVSVVTRLQKLPPSGRDTIQALVDLSPASGPAPGRLPHTLHAAAASALIWALLSCSHPHIWEELPPSSQHFLLALSGTRPIACPVSRQRAFIALRSDFFDTYRLWPAWGLDKYPRLNDRPPIYDLSLWIDSGAISIQGSYWFVTDYDTPSSTRRISAAEAGVLLPPLAKLCGSPPNFIPPQLSSLAFIALSWTRESARSRNNRLFSLPPLSRAFILGICGFYPHSNENEKLQCIARRLCLDPDTVSHDVWLEVTTSPNPSDIPGAIHPCHPEGNPTPARPTRVYRDILPPTPVPGTQPLPFLKYLCDGSSAASIPASSPDVVPSYGRIRSTPRAPFFDELLRMAQVPRPVNQREARDFLARFPALLSRAADLEVGESDLLELTSGIIFGYRIGPHFAGGDSLWEKIPHHPLVSLITWLTGSSPAGFLEHRELAEIAHRSLQHCLAAGTAQEGILQFTTPARTSPCFRPHQITRTRLSNVENSSHLRVSSKDSQSHLTYQHALASWLS